MNFALLANFWEQLKGTYCLGKALQRNGFEIKPLAEYDVIHFATHGLIKKDLPGLNKSALILTPTIGGDPFDDGLLSVSEISRLSLNARLIVLSACNTAKYDLSQAGMGIQDFQTAFTIAGTPTVLAALWSIDSQTASDIVTNFFAAWRATDGATAANPLALATRQFLKQADEPHQHPRFWAAFQVAGLGSIQAGRKDIGSRELDEFKPLAGHEAGGEIVGMGSIGANPVISMIGDWDGTKMASIISSLNADASPKWTVSSHEIGASKIMTSGQNIYALGITSKSHPIPVVRAFDINGRLRWTTRFDDLQDYTLSDVTWTKEGIVIIAFPFLRPNDFNNAFLLRLDDQGVVRDRAYIRVDTRGLVIGTRAFVHHWGNRVAVAINFGSNPRMNADRKSIFGLPSYCYESATANLYEFSEDKLELLATRTVAGFKVGSITSTGAELFLGGEKFDNCAMSGAAALFRFRGEGDAQLIWKENDLFSSNVTGLKAIDRTIVAAVRHERTLGINATTGRSTEPNDKRWGERSAVSRESSLIYFDANGAILKRRNYSAGLAIYVQGLEFIGQEPVLYGSIGGMPAITRH